MSGDIPCNVECGNSACAYNAHGLCRDNCPCEERRKNECKED